MNATLVTRGSALLLGAMLFAVTAVAAFRGRSGRRSNLVGWAMSAAALWALSDVLVAWLASPAAIPWLRGARYLGAATLPITWYAFVAAHTSDGKRPSLSSLARLSLLPIVTAILAGTNPLHQLLWTLPTSSGGPALWYGVHALYGAACWVAGCAALIRDATTPVACTNARVGSSPASAWS
jgi:hypothetical protein